jgi:hypothetical protein
MMHYLYIEANNGDVSDIIAVCSDHCARRYADLNGIEYRGWNGCHELEFAMLCEYCDTIMPGTEGVQLTIYY